MLFRSRKFITDVTEYTDYYRDILYLYPVSYTHLDVYKRQIQAAADGLKDMKEEIDEGHPA